MLSHLLHLVDKYDATIDLCARTLAAEKAATKVESIARLKRIEARKAVAMTSLKNVDVVKLAQGIARYARELRIRAVRAKELHDQAIAVFPAAGVAIVREFMNS